MRYQTPHFVPAKEMVMGKCIRMAEMASLRCFAWLASFSLSPPICFATTPSLTM